MDVLEEALDLFKYCLDFHQEWTTAQRKLKKELQHGEEIEIEGEFTSIERELFARTLQRHAEIAKKFMLDLYADFDLYVIDKNRNPFVIIRSGKKNKKIRFGSKRYPVEVKVEPEEVFTLFDHLAKESFTKKEIEMLNKLYRGTVNICRLQDFMDDIKDDPPSERGEEVVVEMEAPDGRMVRGVLTYSPNATLGKDLDEHLEAINTCKNLSGIEMHFINETEFCLKIIVAKLKRMKSPYITAIQNVVKISEVPSREPASAPVRVSERDKERPEVERDVPPEGFEKDEAAVDVDGGPGGRGAGDGSESSPRGKFAERSEQGDTFEMQDHPFTEHPQAYESAEDQPEPAPAPKRVAEVTGPIKIPHTLNFPRNNCRIQ